jgi:hypothetical protein
LKGGKTLKIFDNIEEETKKSIRDRIANALIDLIVGIILIILQRLF